MKTKYKIITKDVLLNQNIIITDFDMEAIRKIYTFHFKNEKCSKAKSVYLGNLYL